MYVLYKKFEERIISLYIVEIKVTNMNLEQDFILVDIIMDNLFYF